MGSVKETQQATERAPNGQSGIMLYSTYPRHKIL